VTEPGHPDELEAAVESGDSPSRRTGPEILDHWSPRTVRPIVLLYIVAVFVAFVAVSIFVFHSPEAVKALVLAALGALVATVPGVAGRIEHRMTHSGIEKRSVKENPDDFESVFSWDRLERIVPIRHGFKYFEILEETNTLRRFC
jgi:hypothetical protein